MRRLTVNDHGSVAIIVLVAFTGLAAMGAVVVDVGALLQEKRVLQNGADAGALAVAEACGADTCTDPMVFAAQYASANAEDGVSGVEELCGDGLATLSPCVSPPAGVPAGASYVQLTTDTVESDGTTLVPYRFAHLFGFSGGNVQARAVVAWGAPSGLTSELPITISQCEFDAYAASGLHELPIPPYPSPEAIIAFHTTSTQSCDAGPAGSDLPGGFGWLSTSDGCDTFSESGDWYDARTGAAVPKDCKGAMAEMVGTVIKLPIFIGTNDLNGANGAYLVGSYAAFYLTGYHFPGNSVPSVVDGSRHCKGQDHCIYGFFVNWPYGVSGTIGGPPGGGVTVVQLVG